MKNSWVLGLAVGLSAVFGAAASPAFADVTIDSATRYVEIKDLPGYAVDQVVTTGSYVKSITTDDGAQSPVTKGAASQDTDIQSLVFGGSGQSYAQTGTGSTATGPSADSRFSVQFTTDIAYNWFTTGTLYDSNDGGFAVAYAYLYSFATSSYIFYQFGNANSFDITDSGTIAPGKYAFYLTAGSLGVESGNALAIAEYTDAFLTLRPVDDSGPGIPEPASLSILSLGGLLLLHRRRTV